MNIRLLEFLCDPLDKSELTLTDAAWDADGRVISGLLVSQAGRRYPIRDGIPRFIAADDSLGNSVASFGDEWNHFNFDDFKVNWLTHTVANTFGRVAAFEKKVVVDCGAGSGMQSRWIADAGARHVIALELSHSVDDVMQRNLRGVANVDIVQCSIDQPPIKSNSIDGIVICHNVIQHTSSVERTAHALWELVGPGGEFAFNCYPKNDRGLIRKLRLAWYSLLRAVLSRLSFGSLLVYARILSVLRLIPILGWFLEKSGFMVRGDVPPGPAWVERAYKSGVLNTYDCYGSHSFQHLKTDEEIRALVAELQPDSRRVLNADRYFQRPQPIGIALRLLRG